MPLNIFRLLINLDYKVIIQLLFRLILTQTIIERHTMKTLAIIAEYNPFHNGHKYHLEASKSITGADYALTLMSGNFLQRGSVAIADKYTRGRMCAMSGIDLALELPFPYATGSAFDFATGSICILNKLNSVDYLCFGAETPELDLFEKVSDILVNEPATYSNMLKDYLSCGISYPAARQKALVEYAKDSSIKEFVSSPNNILGIEYVCALKRTNSRIKPFPILRKTAGYHDTTIYGDISSATAIRESIFGSKDFAWDIISKDIPLSTLSILQDGFNNILPVSNDSLTPFLQATLLSAHNYEDYCDITKELSNKLSGLSKSITYEEAITKLKTKDITASRISRSIIHMILGYTEAMRNTFFSSGYSLYANILALQKNSSSLLKEIGDKASIPLINKKADFEKLISNYEINHDVAKTMWHLDTKATELYNCIVFNLYGTTLPNDYTTRLPII